MIITLLSIACAIAITDYVRFERACDRVCTVSSELGGHAYSIGGWPLGREYVIRFDCPLTDDALRHFVDAVPHWRRIFVNLYLSCDVSEPRLAAMRRVIGDKPIEIMNPKNKNRR